MRNSYIWQKFVYIFLSLDFWPMNHIALWIDFQHYMPLCQSFLFVKLNQMKQVCQILLLFALDRQNNWCEIPLRMPLRLKPWQRGAKGSKGMKTEQTLYRSVSFVYKWSMTQQFGHSGEVYFKSWVRTENFQLIRIASANICRFILAKFGPLLLTVSELQKLRKTDVQNQF